MQFSLIDNHTYSAIDFTGYLEISELKPGDFTDIDFKIKSDRKQFSLNSIQLTI